MGSAEDAQHGMAEAKPQKQHHWLQQLVGEWTFEGEAAAAPGESTQTFSGTERVRPIGDIWILAEGEGEMPGGGTAKMITTLGYDPQKNRFVGTWFGSMMTHLWVYDGELDAAERVLTLNADGPAGDASGIPAGTPEKFKDVIEIHSEQERTLTGYMLGQDGNWQMVMTARYRSQK